MTEDEKDKMAALQSRGGAGVGERQRLAQAAPGANELCFHVKNMNDL